MPPADVHHAQTAEITVLRAERAIDDRDFLDEFRTECLQRPQIPLPMSLGSLILLDVIQEHLQPTFYAAVIEIEAEATDLERLPVAFMLPGIDAGIKLLQHLIVTAEQGSIEHFRIAQVNRRFETLRADDHALRLRPHRAKLEIGRGRSIRDQYHV